MQAMGEGFMLNISLKELNNSQKDNKEENFEEIKSNYLLKRKIRKTTQEL